MSNHSKEHLNSIISRLATPQNITRAKTFNVKGNAGVVGGKELIQWLQAKESLATREAALSLAQKLVDSSLLLAVQDASNRNFREEFLYQFQVKDFISPPSSSPSSSSGADIINKRLERRSVFVAPKELQTLVNPEDARKGMLISKKDELDNLIAHIQQLMHEASEREEFKEASEYKKKVAQLTEERNKIKKELDQLGYKDDDTDEAIEVDKLSSSGTLSSSPSPPPSSPSQSTPSSRSGTSNQFAQMKPPETTPHVEETSYFIPAKKPTSKTRFADEVQIGQKSKPLIRRSQSTFGGSLSKKGGVKLLDKDSAESTAFEKSESEFFSAIVKASKNILIETKKLTSIDSSTTEEQVLDGAKNTAKATIELMKVINSKIDPSKNLTPKQNYLIESSDQVRAIVFSFIEAAKSYLTNPYDFLSKQSMETKCREVVGAIRQLLLASEYLEKTDDSFLSSKQFNRVDEVKKAINFLKRLNNEVSEKKDINKSCSSLVEITNGIIEDANTLDDEKIPSKIKENLFSLINSARATTRKTTLALKQWDCAKDEYIQSLVEYLKVFGNESNNLDKVPPLCPDDNSPPSSASSQAISTRDTNERRLASKMVDILKSKYSSFRTEWDQQAATKREEVLNLLEGELNKERHRSNELTKVLSAKSNSDLRTLRRLERSGPQDNFEAIDPSNISSQLIDCASSCGEITIDVLLCVHDSVGDLDNLRNRNDLSNQDTQFNQNISSLVQSLKRAIDLLKVWVSVDKPSISASSFNINKTIDTEGEYKVINSLLDTLSQTLSTTIIKPKLIQSVIKTVSESQATEMGNYFSMKIKIEQTLQSLVHRECSSLRSLSLQLMTALNALAAQQSKIDLQTVFQALPLVKTILNKLDKITETYHTLIYILSIEQNTNLSVALNKKESASGDNIWEVADTKCVTGKDGEFLGGTLNHIIIKLTSEQDSKFESSFITTYQSFTTPWILLEKLHQRYHIPKDKKLDPQICLRIKLRVCVVLQHWIRIQFHDFDPKIIEKLENFIVDIEKDQKSMADKLRREVEKKSKELKRSRRASMAIDPYLQLKVPEGGFSPMKLVLESTESEISRQLTMIEFKLFAKIQSSELLDQAWNTPKLQYRSSNVLGLISHANQLSFWVASMILLPQKADDRAKIVDKFVKVADNLYELGNFHALLAVFAGFNISAISRLKQTFSLIKKTSQQTLKKLQVLFDPSNSYKNYRKEQKEATARGPCLPYLATALSDLTFTEDGNPNFLDNDDSLINFAKRELICTIIRQIQLNQLPAYSFPIVEPVHTFLSELHHFDEKELYSLSLHREPRESNTVSYPQTN